MWEYVPLEFLGCVYPNRSSFGDGGRWKHVMTWSGTYSSKWQGGRVTKSLQFEGKSESVRECAIVLVLGEI